MLQYTSKVFVQKSSEDDEEENIEVVEDIEENNTSGDDVSAFYDSLCNINTTKDEKSEDQHPESYFCDICNIDVLVKDKIEHTCSTSHQLNRNKGHQDDISKKFYFIPKGNPGYQMLLRNGWNEKGLGKNEEGSLDPIQTRIKNDRLGIGVTPLCPLRVSHSTAFKPPKRPNLYHRTIPNVDKMDVFTALDTLRTTPEQQYCVSKRHREILLKRDRLKKGILYRELYR